MSGAYASGGVVGGPRDGSDRVPAFLSGCDYAPVNALWWLSFVDTTRSAPLEEQVPGGGGFLGVAVMEAPTFLAAVDRAHRLGINPGGEVAGFPIPREEVGVEWRHRLLTAAEVDDMQGVPEGGS